MNINKIFLYLLVITTFSSCQKVIKINLNGSSPKFVIIGNVTDEPGPYTIKITKSVNFDQDNVFPGVHNAVVYITDQTLNITDTLSEISGGNYQTHFLSGVSGHTYQLYVTSDNNVFTSSSIMPARVPLDSIYTQKSLFGSGTDVVPIYKDPVGVGNQYHIILKIKDSISSVAVYIHDDALQDGNLVSEALMNSIDIHSGDSVMVELQCIDKNVFQYYTDLSATIQQNSAAPSNPQSNITGGALGYFSAHTSSRKSIIAQ